MDYEFIDDVVPRSRELPARQGAALRTYSGFWINPADPAPEAIAIEDIAHHLSCRARFSGATRSFYSVAQHSVLVSHNCDGCELAGLLHDAGEAYGPDIPSPIRADFPLWTSWEARILNAVADRFGIDWADASMAVEIADARAFLTECRDLFDDFAAGNQDARGGVPKFLAPFAYVIKPLAPELAENLFLSRFRELTVRCR